MIEVVRNTIDVDLEAEGLEEQINITFSIFFWSWYW